MKKLLLISYCYPPMAAVGVYRTIKFVKYFRKFGWEPIVLTVREPDTKKFDKMLLDDIPDDILVYRTRNFSPLTWWQRRKIQQQQLTKATKPSSRETSSTSLNPPRGLARIKAFIAASLSTPDADIGWVPFAYCKAMRIIRKHKIDCIYTSTPPHSGHLIGYWLKKRTGLPFVADFRAPWSQNEYFDERKLFPSLKNLEEKMELAIHKSANAVIANSTYEAAGYREKYADLVGDKFTAILNGYDPSDFDLDKCVTFDRFTIVYIGSLYGRRDPDTFFQGVKQLLDKRPEIKDDFKLLLIGIKTPELAQTVAQYGLNDVIEMIGFLPQREAYRYLIGANLLLIILGFVARGHRVIPAKIFEYLYAGRPILALVTEGETSKMIRDTDAGTVISQPDADLVEQALSKYYDDYKATGTAVPQFRPMEQYTREHQTGQLVEILNRVTAE